MKLRQHIESGASSRAVVMFGQIVYDLIEGLPSEPGENHGERFRGEEVAVGEFLQLRIRRNRRGDVRAQVAVEASYARCAARACNGVMTSTHPRPTPRKASRQRNITGKPRPRHHRPPFDTKRTRQPCQALTTSFTPVNTASRVAHAFHPELAGRYRVWALRKLQVMRAWAAEVPTPATGP